MAFKMKGFSPFTKETHYHQKKNKNVGGSNINEYPTRPLKPGEGDPKGGVAPLTGPGRIDKILKTFTKVATKRSLISKKIQKLLEKKGYKFK